MVALEDADGPRTGERAPDLMRNLGSNSVPAISAEDEEFGDVTSGLASGNGRFLFDQYKACPMAVGFDEKRVPAWRAPIERQVRIAKLPVRAQVNVKEFAEVVDVELEQVGDDRLLFGRRGDEVDVRQGAYAASFAGSSA